MLGGLLGQFDSRNIEVPRGLHEKEAIGAPQFQQSPAGTIMADEMDAAGELAAQDRLGTEVVGVAVGAPAGKIVLGIVGRGIKPGGFGAAETAFFALQNAAPVDLETKQVTCRLPTGRTGERDPG